MLETKVKIENCFGEGEKLEYSYKLLYFSNHERIVSCNEDKLMIWNIVSGECEFFINIELTENEFAWRNEAYSLEKWTDEVFLCGEKSGRISCYSVKTGQLVKEFLTNAESVHSLLKIDDLRFVSVEEMEEDNFSISLYNFNQKNKSMVLLDDYKEDWWADLFSPYLLDGKDLGISDCSLILSSRIYENSFYISTRSRISNYDLRMKVRLINVDKNEITKNFEMEVTRTYYTFNVCDDGGAMKSMVITSNRDHREILIVLYREAYSDIIQLYDCETGFCLRKFCILEKRKETLQGGRIAEIEYNTQLCSMYILPSHLVFLGDEKGCVQILDGGKMLEPNEKYEIEDEITDGNEIHNLEPDLVEGDLIIMERTHVSGSTTVDEEKEEEEKREGYGEIFDFQIISNFNPYICKFFVHSSWKSEKNNSRVNKILKISFKSNGKMFGGSLGENVDLEERIDFLIREMEKVFSCDIDSLFCIRICHVQLTLIPRFFIT